MKTEMIGRVGACFSLYKPGYGYVDHFVSKYDHHDIVKVKHKGEEVTGEIVAANMDDNMSFQSWQVRLPFIEEEGYIGDSKFFLGDIIHVDDPDCPWSKVGYIPPNPRPIITAYDS